MATGGRALQKLETQKPQTEILSVEEQIRRRAYAIWIERGDREGSDVTDWLQAEDEIRRKQEGL